MRHRSLVGWLAVLLVATIPAVFSSNAVAAATHPGGAPPAAAPAPGAGATLLPFTP